MLAVVEVGEVVHRDGEHLVRVWGRVRVRVRVW